MWHHAHSPQVCPMTPPQSAAVVPTVGDIGQRESHDHKTIAYGGGLLLLASMFGNGLNYVFGIFLARMLGPVDFGLYALALTLFNILTLAVVCGIDVGVVKFVSHHLVEGQFREAKATFVAAALIAFGSGLISAVGLTLLAPFIAIVVYGKPEITLSLRLFAVAIPFATTTIVLLSALQAFQIVRYTILVKYLWEPVAKFMFAAVLVWAGLQLPGVLISITLALAISASLVASAAHRLVSDSAEKPVLWSTQEARRLLTYCLPLAVSNVFGVVAPRSDILLLGYWANTQDVGVYLAAFQTAAVMALVLSAFDIGLAPIISRAWSQQDQIRLRESYQAVARLSITVSLPIFCCLLLFSNEILSMFGPQFESGATALILLTFGQIVNNAAGSANTVLLMSGQSRFVMKNTIIMGIVLLATTATIIPFWGINGAAIAASTTFILTNIVRGAQVWRLHHVQPYTWDFVKPIVAAVSTSIIILMLRSVLPLPSPVLAVIMGMLYLTVLWQLGINRQDRQMLESLSPRGKCIFERE